ncbi:MAG: hypothetical protein HYY45_01180 [Deltaproteobacteria bacterium]|nr:hypothetical protein [Deltaproteobacteria bacterium]
MVGKFEILKTAFGLSTWLLLVSLVMVSDGVDAAASGLTRTHSGGGVTVKATYLNPHSPGDVRFQVTLDTHSVDLDEYDLKDLSLLRDETGKTYQSTRVDNKGSGHHRQITVIFPKVSPETRWLELVIKDIAGVKERSLRWDLSQ